MAIVSNIDSRYMLFLLKLNGAHWEQKILLDFNLRDFLFFYYEKKGKTVTYDFKNRNSFKNIFTNQILLWIFSYW